MPPSPLTCGLVLSLCFLQGSSSFRHVYLSRGAHVILVGTPVGPMVGSSWEHLGGSTFFELPLFFPGCDYKVVKYPTDPAAPEWGLNLTDVALDTLTPDMRADLKATMFKSGTWVNITRMSKFVQSALHAVESASQWLDDT